MYGPRWPTCQRCKRLLVITRARRSRWEYLSSWSGIEAITRFDEDAMSAAVRVGVVCLGYVGLPLAVAFGRRFPTVGYDLSAEKVKAYRAGQDPTGEVPSSLLR